MCSDISELASATRAWAKDVPEIRAVLLFGSRAKGNPRPDSDWDICVVVDGDSGNTWYGIWCSKKKEWKKQFCKACDLPLSEVQFCSPTSDKVRLGLEKCVRVLFLRDFDQVLKIKTQTKQ